MRSPALTFAWVLAVASSAPAIAQTPSRTWTPLLVTEGDRVDVDRVTIETVGSVRRVWLRWRYGTGDKTQFRIERHEVNCSQRRDRILAARRVERDERGRDRLMDSVPAPAEMSWSTPSIGSIAGQVINAVCNSGRAGA